MYVCLGTWYVLRNGYVCAGWRERAVGKWRILQLGSAFLPLFSWGAVPNGPGAFLLCKLCTLQSRSPGSEIKWFPFLKAEFDFPTKIYNPSAWPFDCGLHAHLQFRLSCPAQIRAVPFPGRVFLTSDNSFSRPLFPTIYKCYCRKWPVLGSTGGLLLRSETSISFADEYSQTWMDSYLYPISYVETKWK